MHPSVQTSVQRARPATPAGLTETLLAPWTPAGAGPPKTQSVWLVVCAHHRRGVPPTPWPLTQGLQTGHCGSCLFTRLRLPTQHSAALSAGKEAVRIRSGVAGIGRAHALRGGLVVFMFCQVGCRRLRKRPRAEFPCGVRGALAVTGALCYLLPFRRAASCGRASCGCAFRVGVRRSLEHGSPSADLRAFVL